MNEPTVSYETITPAQAQAYLLRNFDQNRNVKTNAIDRYARDMAAGRWHLSGESIKFDTSDRLVDGQNRLRAIIRSNTSVRMLVARGLSSEAVAQIDSGTSRTAADSIIIGGVADRTIAKDAAAIARTIIPYRRGELTKAGQRLPSVAEKLTNSELSQYLVSHPEVIEAASYVMPAKRAIRLPVGALGTAYVLFREINIDDTADYFHRIRDGIQHGVGDPFRTLNEKVRSDRDAAGRTPMEIGTALYYLLRTWNAFRAHETLTSLRLNHAGDWVKLPVLK